MIAHQIADIIANFAVFFSLSDDEIVAPDVRESTMGTLGRDMRALDKDFLRDVVGALPAIAERCSDQGKAVLLDLPRRFRLDEVLAGKEPQ